MDQEVNNSEIYEKETKLLSLLKEIDVCESCGFNETYKILAEVDTSALNEALEMRGIDTLEIIESALDVERVMKKFDGEKTVEGIKAYFMRRYYTLSDKEAQGIYNKYIKSNAS